MVVNLVVLVVNLDVVLLNLVNLGVVVNLDVVHDVLVVVVLLVVNLVVVLGNLFVVVLVVVLVVQLRFNWSRKGKVPVVPASESPDIYFRYKYSSNNRFFYLSVLLCPKFYDHDLCISSLFFLSFFHSLLQLLSIISSSNRFLNDSSEGAIFSSMGRRFHFCPTR